MRLARHTTSIQTLHAVIDRFDRGANDFNSVVRCEFLTDGYRGQKRLALPQGAVQIPRYSYQVEESKDPNMLLCVNALFLPSTDDGGTANDLGDCRTNPDRLIDGARRLRLSL